MDHMHSAYWHCTHCHWSAISICTPTCTRARIQNSKQMPRKVVDTDSGSHAHDIKRTIISTASRSVRRPSPQPRLPELLLARSFTLHRVFHVGLSDGNGYLGWIAILPSRRLTRTNVKENMTARAAPAMNPPAELATIHTVILLSSVPIAGAPS